MTKIVPPATPRIGREAVARVLDAHHIVSKVAFVGIRGYYKNSFGEPERNDWGVYDDAMLLISPEVFATFNANTDPSVNRTGVAVLQPGLWWYRIGTHNISKPPQMQYQAFVQAATVHVKRTGTENYAAGTKHVQYGEALGDGVWAGFFGINIHRGAQRTTSSLGCQTIFPTQWEAFRHAATNEMRRYLQVLVPYLLLTDVPT